jgi:hypothetical protein
MRQWLNENPAVVTIGAIVLMVLAFLGILYQMGVFGGGDRTDRAYYFDRNTERMVVGDTDATPPIDTGSGEYNGEPAGVRVTIFACGSCSNFKGMTMQEVADNGGYVAYLTKYPLEMKRELESENTDITRMPQMQRQFTTPDLWQAEGEDAWIGSQDQRARRHQSRRPDCGQDTRPKLCLTQ